MMVYLRGERCMAVVRDMWRPWSTLLTCTDARNQG